MILINGIEGSAIDPCDRGFCYGDGVFRTFPVRGGRALHWQRQYEKLAADGVALHLQCPTAELLFHDVQKLIAAKGDGVIRITLTRGAAARGYAIPANAKTTRVVGWSLPGSVTKAHMNGIRARWCNLRLAIQPALAGIKHLNRLENVLARSEWNDEAIAEGLMLDANGHVISGTMSNLFIERDGRLLTPALDGCGVAGVTRALILEGARADCVDSQIGKLEVNDVRAADALFLVNSVVGVWQVAALDDLRWKASPLAERLRYWIADGETR